MRQLEDACQVLNEIAHSSPSDDDFGVYEVLEDVTMSNIGIIVKLHRQVVPKVNDILVAYNTLKSQLEDVNKQLSAKEEELESARNCSNCVKLQNDLARSRKKLAVNENRIKTIAKLLTRDIPCTEDVDRNYASDDSSVSKAYNLVSQVLGCEPLAGSGEYEEEEAANTAHAKASHTVEESLCEEDDVIICSLEETNAQDELPQTPKKPIRPRKEVDSPILGKIKKPPLQKNDGDEACRKETTPARDIKHNESVLCISPSPCKERSSRSVVLTAQNITPKRFKLKLSPKTSPKGSPKKKPAKSPRKSPRKSPFKKRKADFWELKTTCNVLGASDLFGGNGGKKLKQAQLSFGQTPEVTDLCSLKDFNGGIRQSQTSTQISKKVGENVVEKPFLVPAEKSPGKQRKKVDEDIILDSPQGTRARSKQKSRLFQKLSLDGRASMKRSAESCEAAGREPQRNLTGVEQKRHQLEDFDQLPRKPETSPKFKYREGPVRKKDERKKLNGWDCENCKKYYEACGAMSESERKTYMNRCSRHRDKHPVRMNTPPGFWDADFPETEALEALNQTHTDVLFSKKSKDEYGSSPTN